MMVPHRGGNCMKIEAQRTIGRIETSARALLPTILAVLLATGAPVVAARALLRPAPPDKGAAGLLLRPEQERLPDEAENPRLGALAEAWQRCAPELGRIPTVRSNQLAYVAIQRIRLAPGRPVLFLLHGILSDHETWQYVAAATASDYELWLADLPGCGESDSLKPSDAEPDAYSLTALGERMLQVLRDCLADTTPAQRLTLVGHSLGASVEIRMLSAPHLQTNYSDVLLRVDHAVLLAPCDLALNSVPQNFITVLGLQHWMISAGDVLGVTDARLRQVVRAGYQQPGCATIQQQSRFSHNVKDSAHLKASQWMLRSAIPFDKKTLRPIWNEIDPLVADYARIRTPVLIIFGERDETLSASMGNKLKDEIPGASLVKVPGCGHSLPTEEPAVCSRLIRWFQQGCKRDEMVAGCGLKVYGPLGDLTGTAR